jgi:hypothetical protein
MSGNAGTLRLAVAAYLARFKGSSREHTQSGLRCYLSWCTERGLDPLAARRPHLELYIRWMQEIRRFKPSTCRGVSGSRPGFTGPALSTASWSATRTTSWPPTRDTSPEPAQRLVAASGAEGRQPQPGQPIQVGDAVQRGDPAAGDCDRDERHRPAPDGDQHPGYAVDQHRGEVG